MRPNNRYCPAQKQSPINIMDVNPESPIFTGSRVISQHKELICLKRKFENGFIPYFTSATKTNSTDIENIPQNFD
jgi:hypothetical protein